LLPTATGTYEWVASYSGDANNRPVSSSKGAEPQDVSPATPGISTVPGGTVVVGSGNRLTDSASLSGGFNPTGSITFTLFAPDGTTVVDTETVAVHGDGTYTTPTGLLPTATGTYEWVATYSGDANNISVSSIKGDEPQAVIPAVPAITTVPGGSVVLGSGNRLTDSASLSGAHNPTGSITFTLFAPNSSTVVDTETVAVNGNGTYTTPSGFLPTAAGTYEWVASYSGDANNNPVSSEKGAEPEKVSPASPAITTTTGGTVTAGRAVLIDSATLSGGFSPTGTITFTLFAPNGSIVDIEQVAVNGNGTYSTLHGFMPAATAPGTYQWVATYSGDSNNNAIASAFGSEPEVAMAAPVQIISKRLFVASNLGHHRHAKVTKPHRHHGKAAHLQNDGLVALLHP
jgi:hypothetical protein